MANPKNRAERDARLRAELAQLAELRMQAGFLAQQCRHYEILIMGAAEAIGKLLATIDGVLGELEKNPRAVKDKALAAMLRHLKSEREKLSGQAVQLGEIATSPPILQGRLPRTPVAPTPAQAQEEDQGGERPGAGDPPKRE